MLINEKYNDTTYAILGILTTDCKSGYEVKQLIDRSLHHFWKISYGQIYPALKLIVEEGLAKVSPASTTGRSDKREYHLTEKGWTRWGNGWRSRSIKYHQNEMKCY